MKSFRSLLFAFTTLATPAMAAPLSSVSFESGDLTGWTAYGGASTLASDQLSLGGSNFELGAKGAFMAKILPDGSSVYSAQAESLLGLSAGTFANSGVDGLAQSTNFGLITGSFALAAGTYSFGWSYAAQDYAPFDDGVFFSLVGGSLSQVSVLASNFTGQPDTVIVGTYGSTPWQLTSFTITQAGTYQLGFGAYNWGDDGVDPILYLDDGIGSLSQNGVVVPPVGGGPPTIDTAQPSYVASALAAGTVLPIFDGGTLQVDAAGSYATALTINAPGGTIDTSGNDAIFSGDVDGDGGLTKSGAGTLTLTGANSYAGGTSISAGTLAGDTTSLQGDIVDNATLVFDQASDGTYGGSLSGSGHMVKQGAGTITFAGNSGAYAGTIALDRGGLLLTGTLGGAITVGADGTLQVGNIASSGNLLADVVNNGALIFANDGDTDYAGALSGTGSLVKTGAGILTLSGDYSYTGATIVMEGGVQVVSVLPQQTDLVIQGGTTDLGVNDQAVRSLSGAAGTILLNGNIFTVDQAVNTQFAGALTGDGTFVKTGAGILNLTGASSFDGSADVNAGRLAINGSIGSIVRVNGGTIGGNGTVSGLVVGAGGTAAPGNSIGTIHVAGDVTFAAGSTYTVETDAAGNSDMIVATGNLLIQGGTVAVLAGTDDYAPLATYTILTADGGRTGTFTGVTSDLAYLTPLLSYGANTVMLTLARNDIRFAAVANTPNQRAAAGAAEQLGLGNPIWNAAIQLAAADAPAAFDSLSGEIHASARTAIVEDARTARSAVLDRLDEPGGERASIWGRVLGSWGNDDGDANAASVDRDTTGLLTGIDAPIGEDVRVGLGGGYTKTDLKVPARASDATIKGAHILGYAGGIFGRLRVRVGMGYSQVDLNTNRSASVGAFSDRLHADYDGSVVQSFGEIAYAAPLGGGTVSPFVNLAAVRTRTDAFAETGGSAALEGASRRNKNAFSVVGAHVETPQAGPLSLRATMGWQHGFGTLVPRTSVGFVGGPLFSIAGAPISRNAALLEAELGVKISATARIGTSYAGQIGDRGQDHAIRANLTISF